MREYKLIRSDRKSLALQVRDGELIARAQRAMPKARIEAVILEKEAWIERHIRDQLEKKAAHPQPDEAEEARLRTLAREILPGRLEYYSALTGLKPKSMKISSAKTRFGSCSSRGSICFSWRLMAYPPAAVDYVVLHELCHLRHLNHSRDFYALVERYMPDWKQRRELLKK